MLISLTKKAPKTAERATKQYESNAYFEKEFECLNSTNNCTIDDSLDVKAYLIELDTQRSSIFNVVNLVFQNTEILSMMKISKISRFSLL